MAENTVIHVLASAIETIRRIEKQKVIKENDQRWINNRYEVIIWLEKNYLPSGSGIDAGCRVGITASKADKIVIETSFHHMDEHGYYDGWTEHTVTITPSLVYDFNMKITGRDRNQIKDYLHDTFRHALTAKVDQFKYHKLLTQES